MKRWIGLALLVFVAAAGWRIGSVLSPDALSMATGVLFGVMAGVPTALLVMASNRRRDREEREAENRTRQQQVQHAQPMQQGWAAPYAQQPPIVIVAGPQGFGNQALQPPQPNVGWLPQEPLNRQFTVVGNGEDLTEDW